jgi:methylmalonyl-CoA mutase
MSTVTDRKGSPPAAQAGNTPLRFVTSTSLFDGHDAAINVMRRLIQDSGAEVVHLGHNRSVRDIVRAAIQEDADGVAISSYQGGHAEYFGYAVEMLREAGADHIRVFGGGGGTITPREIADLQEGGVERIYHPNDGMSLGLVGMIDDLVERATAKRVTPPPPEEDRTDDLGVARMLSALEDGVLGEDDLERLRTEWTVKGAGVPVIGVTGTGGAGKSTVTDELLSRFVQYLPELRIAVLAVDPTRRRTGGALLGDRIRMNSLRHEQIYMRSMATRRQNLSTTAVLADAVSYLRAAEFDLVIVETAGIGQSDS